MAVRLALDSWRWAGVPILIRAGKCMPVTATEVTIRFNRPPHDFFGARRRVDDQRAALPDLARSPRRSPSPGRSPAPAVPQRRGPGVRAAAGIRHAPLRPAHRGRPDGTAGCSPGRTRSRPPGGSSTRCSATWSPCSRTRGAAGARRRPTGCCPTATPGTTRPAEQMDDHRGGLARRVVIVGGGFAGLFAARALGPAGRGHPRRPSRAPPVPAAALRVRNRDAVRGTDSMTTLADALAIRWAAGDAG